MRAVLLFSITVFLLGGCEQRFEAPLLDLDSVDSRVIERGAELLLRGEDLPQGKEARLLLEGIFHAAGKVPRPVVVEMPASIPSRETISGQVTEPTIRALGGRGTFRGNVTVLVEGHGDMVASGTLDDVGIHVHAPRPDTDGRVVDLLDRLGLTLELGEEEGEGLPIQAVEEGSPAALVGLAAGDRLLEGGGVLLEDPGDLVPAPSADGLHLLVRRPDLPEPFVVNLPISSKAEVPVAFGAWLYIGLVLALLLFSPLAGVVAAAIRGRHRSPSPEGRSAIARTGIGIFAVALTTSLVLSLFSIPLHLGLLPLLALGLHPVLGRALETSLGKPLPGALLLAGVTFTPVIAAVITVLFIHGSLDLDSVTEAQGWVPWDWYLFRQPLLVLLFPMILWIALDTSPAGGWQGAIFRGVVCFLLVHLLLGGGAGLGPLLGAVVVGLKTAMLWTLATATASPRSMRSLPGTAGASAAIVFVGYLHLLFPMELPAATPWLLLVGSVMLVAMALRHRPTPHSLSPLL